MRVEIITTGEEVLCGQIVDTNVAWISDLLNQHGFDVVRRTTVGDQLQALSEVLGERSRVADVVIVNGGLGPTSDDLTAAACADAMRVELVENQAWVAVMEEKFTRTGRQMPSSNLKQAQLPERATIIDNPVGTACGFQVQFNRARLFFTPGPPSEFKLMVSEQILPALLELEPQLGSYRLWCLQVFGIGESRLGKLLEIVNLPAGVQLGYRPHMPTVEVKIMARGEGDLDRRVASVAEQIRAILGAAVYAQQDQSMVSIIQREMLHRKWTIALAESCTGGMVADRLVRLGGSSGYVDRGLVTYSDRAKQELLGVSEVLLKTHGAVSAETASAMAEGVRDRADSDVAISVTGIAGPTGGSESKPVGTVAFALVTPDADFVQVLWLPQWGRTRIRMISATIALDMLRRYLTGEVVCAEYDFVAKATGERL